MRLAKAKKMFGDERKGLEETLNFVTGNMTGYEMIGWDETPGIRLRVRIDQKRFFVVQIAHYGDKNMSKQKPTVRFSDDVNRSQSIQPQGSHASLFGPSIICSQDS